MPEYPTLFAKFASSLLGAHDDIVLPMVSDSVDWEAELGVIIGSPVRRASTEEASAAIAGYTVVNDMSMRDWQWRTSEWLQGKAFEASATLLPGDLISTGTPGGASRWGNSDRRPVGLPPRRRWPRYETRTR